MSSSPVFRSPLYEMEASLSVSVPVRARLCQYSHVQVYRLVAMRSLSRCHGVEEGLFTMVAFRSEEDVARLILDDLLCESPTYAYALTEAGRYREHLHLLLGVRTGSGGLIAAQRTCESLKARDPLFAALS